MNKRYILLSFLIITSICFAEELTSENLFGDITLENIEKVNPLKDKTYFFDKESKDYKFIDEDKDKADDRLEKYLNGNKEYNPISKLFMFQKLYLYDYFINHCVEQKLSKKCLKIFHSLGQFRLRNICRKEFKKKLKISPMYKDIHKQNIESETVRNIKLHIMTSISSEDYSSDDQYIMILPDLNCIQKIERKL